MSAVPWSTLDPNVCEDVVAIMKCRENPDTVRVRPSRGDGGIDLIRLTGDGWVVDQIKYFHQNLTGKHKAQVWRSFDEVRAYAASQGATIAAWHLVLPLDPTKENFLDWFHGELTKDAGFPCRWYGLAYLEGLAGTYPDVVDYHLGNGKERVLDLVSQMVTGFSLVHRATGAAENGQLQPADTLEGLEAIYAALNAHDPHYRYSFAVDQDMPALPPAEPFLVAAVRFQTPTVYVTFKIYARFADATSVRPVPFMINLHAAQDGDTARAWEDFLQFGAPISITSGQDADLEISLDLPGGLGGHYTNATAIFGPVILPGEVSGDLRMQILDPGGRVLATARLRLDHVTAGQTGHGKRWVGAEEQGVFDIELRFAETEQDSSIVVRGRDLTGLRPAEVLDGLRAVVAFRAPNLVRFAPPYGPVTGSATPVNPQHVRSGSWDEGVVKLVEALAVIQEHTGVQITVPDLTEVTDEIGNELIQVAAILSQGESQSTWTGMTCLVPAQSSVVLAPDTPGPAEFSMPLVARIGTVRVALGHARYACASARVQSVTPVEGDLVRVRLVPGEDPTVSIRYDHEAA